jgi:hypothetical protein
MHKELPDVIDGSPSRVLIEEVWLNGHLLDKEGTTELHVQVKLLLFGEAQHVFSVLLLRDGNELMVTGIETANDEEIFNNYPEFFE